MEELESKILVGSGKTFSFIGYEPNDLGGFDNDEGFINKWVKFSLKVMISHLSSIHKGIVFISGCSPGTETWASEEVINLRSVHPEKDMKLLIVLPCESLSGRLPDGSPMSPRPWPLKSHDRMQSIVNSADEVLVLGSGSMSADKMRTRDKWVIERSLGVLFVMDDSKKNPRVAEATTMAVENNCQSCMIDPMTETIYLA